MTDTIINFLTDIIGDGFFERYQQELLESYQLNKANELVTEFKQLTKCHYYSLF
ncbi:hypothetical protein KP714_08960 [Staphylococcus aureus]|nr:hypothetical protein KP714_08960 [Staphylococcus aureus]